MSQETCHEEIIARRVGYIYTFASAEEKRTTHDNKSRAQKLSDTSMCTGAGCIDRKCETAFAFTQHRKQHKTTQARVESRIRKCKETDQQNA